MKRALRYALLALPPLVGIMLTLLVTTGAGLRWTFARFLPALTSQSIDGRLIGPITLRHARFTGPAADIEAESLSLDWSPVALLRGRAHVTRLHADSLRVTLHPTSNGAATEETFVPSINIVLDDLRVSRFALAGNGESVLDLAQIELAGSWQNQRLRVEHLRLRGAGIAARLRGDARVQGASLEGDIDWDVELEGFAPLAGHGRILADSRRLTLRQRITAPFAAELDAAIASLDTEPRWHVHLSGLSLSPDRIRSGLPRIPVTGELRAQGNLEYAELNANFAHKDTRAHMTASLRSGQFDVRADWTNLVWPLATDTPFSSPRGMVHIEGTMDHYRFRTDSTLRVHAATDMRLTAHGQGDRRGLSFSAIDLTAPGAARLSASGTWHPPHTDVRWQLEAPDVSRVLPESAGAITSHGHVRGAWPRIAVSGDLNAKGLSYAGYRIGTLALRADVDASDTAPSRVTATMGDASVRDHAVREARIEAAGTRAAHRLDVKLVNPDGDEIALNLSARLAPNRWSGEITLARASLVALGDWATRESTPFSLARTQARLETLCLHQQPAQLCFAGGWQAPDGYTLRASANNMPATVLAAVLPPGLSLTGALDGHANLEHQTATGLVGDAALRLTHGEFFYDAGDSLRIAHRGAQVRLGAANRRVTLDATAGLTDHGELALAGDVPQALLGLMHGNDRQLRARLRVALPDIGPLAPLVPMVEKPAGALRADMSLAGTPRRPRVTGDAALESASFTLPALGIRIRDAALRVRGDDGERLAIDGVARSGDGEMRVAGEIDLYERAPASARLRLRGERVEIVNTPEYWLLASPDLELSIAGTAVTINGEVGIPQAKLLPRELAGAAAPSPDIIIVQAGGEEPDISRWQIATDARVVLGEKVRLEGFGFRGWIAGDMTIADKPPQPALARGELRVTAGHYELYGQTLDVERGKLIFAGGPIEDPGLDIRAVRRIDTVKAGVQARGTLKHPELTLFSQPAMSETDVLSYLLLGRPIDQATANEGESLYQAANAIGFSGGELLAKRIGTAFGLEEVRLEQRGPQQGANLVLSKYLTPRLYVSYGVGLFETVDTIRIRYQLGKRWLLQTETGETSGADLLYTIER